MVMPPSLALHLGRVLRRCAGAAADAQLALLPAAARLLEGTLPGGWRWMIEANINPKFAIVYLESSVKLECNWLDDKGKHVKNLKNRR